MRFMQALAYPFRAFALLSRTPRLWGYVAVPIAVNLVLGAILYAALIWLGFQAIEGLLDRLPDWLDPAGWIVRISLVLALFVAVAYVLVRFGVILGSPWYARLSERIEVMQTGAAPPANVDGLGGAMREILRTLAFEIRKLALVLSISLILLLIDFIPGLGTIVAGAGGIALGTLVACLDFLGPSLDRRRLGLRAQMGVIRRGLPGTAGLGLVCFGLISIPFLNLLLIPLCVTAGTLYFVDHLRVEKPAATRLRRDVPGGAAV